MKEKKKISKKPSIQLRDTELENYTRLRMVKAYGRLKKDCLRIFPKMVDCFPAFAKLTTDQLEKIHFQITDLDELNELATTYKKKNPEISIFYPAYYLDLGIMNLEAALRLLNQRKFYQSLESLFSATERLSIYFTYMNQFYYSKGDIRNIDTISLVPPKILEDAIVKRRGTDAASRKHTDNKITRRALVKKAAEELGWGKFTLEKMAEKVHKKIKSEHPDLVKANNITTYQRDLRFLKYKKIK